MSDDDAIRVPPPVTTGSSSEDLDRVVSRRVDHPTDATADDERAYRAAAPSAEPEPDTASGGSGGAAERASTDEASDDESEPTRSE